MRKLLVSLMSLSVLAVAGAQNVTVFDHNTGQFDYYHVYRGGGVLNTTTGEYSLPDPMNAVRWQRNRTPSGYSGFDLFSGNSWSATRNYGGGYNLYNYGTGSMYDVSPSYPYRLW